MPFQAPADTLTYEPYFGLNEKPFSLNADPRFVYGSAAYAAARESLLAGIRRREGLLVLTGEIGTGKTTLCRAVLRDLGRKTHSSMVPDPFASREDLLKTLLIDFGVTSIHELTADPLRQASRTELSYLLSEFLNSLAPDTYAVAIIDEAQNLSLPLIEEIRILSDTLGAEGRLQIIFVGQPELHAKLKLPEMRQVDQRVCGYHRLTPLSNEAVAGYIQHRLHVAGGPDARVLFPPAIIDTIHQRTGGVPRLINRVCDRALQLACERQAAGVDREILDTALIEVGSATLSPTWDAIVFAAPTARPRANATAPAPPVGHAVDTTAPADVEEHFSKQVDTWVAQDLAAPPPPPVRPKPARSGPAKGIVASPAERRPASKTAQLTKSRGGGPVRTVTTDWPRDLRSETYIQRLFRKWTKWAAIGLAAFVALNVAIAGGSLLADALTPVVPPALPLAPAPTLPGIIAVPQPAGTTGAAPAEEFLVAVGLFSSRDGADQIFDRLTQAGLPAMQRSIQRGRQEFQQVVLGPFFSRAAALVELRRLQELGGYDDAGVVAHGQ